MAKRATTKPSEPSIPLTDLVAPFAEIIQDGIQRLHDAQEDTLNDILRRLREIDRQQKDNDALFREILVILNGRGREGLTWRMLPGRVTEPNKIAFPPETED